jgi:polynucleotide 5'-hydroxyl-kinase GRC3/NOL9
MSQDWADRVAQQLLNRGLIQRGICLLLGAADTGKTTLAAILAKYVASNQPVGIIDADIGQSHIGPPTTVAWAIAENPKFNLSELSVRGMSFVGDVTPAGHLLQLTAAITQCVQQVSEVTELTIIDTPGFVLGPAAAVLWWTIQRILQPKLILAVQREPILQKVRRIGAQCSNELSDIIASLQFFETHIEFVGSPPQIPIKSPHDRQSYRQNQFGRYFRNSCLYNISLSNIAIQASYRLSRENLLHRIVALRNGMGADIAIGLIEDWQDDESVAVVRAPNVDIQQTRCLVIGDISIDIADG